ncbi:MAG: acyl carrier protein [Solirubrobacteraceae bacterium]
MTPAHERLRRCFEIAFPDLAPERIPTASVETVAEWDSLHALILVALIEEAFEIRIPSRDYPELRSHAAVTAYLQRVTHDGN